MRKSISRVLPSLLLLLVCRQGELPASTFGGSTGPRQGVDENLPRVQVDQNTYRRTKARLSIDEIAPLVLPQGSYVVKTAGEEIIEYNLSFVIIPRE